MTPQPLTAILSKGLSDAIDDPSVSSAERNPARDAILLFNLDDLQLSENFSYVKFIPLLE